MATIVWLTFQEPARLCTLCLSSSPSCHAVAVASAFCLETLAVSYAPCTSYLLNVVGTNPLTAGLRLAIIDQKVRHGWSREQQLSSTYLHSICSGMPAPACRRTSRRMVQLARAAVDHRAHAWRCWQHEVTEATVDTAGLSNRALSLSHRAGRTIGVTRMI